MLTFSPKLNLVKRRSPLDFYHRNECDDFPHSTIGDWGFRAALWACTSESTCKLRQFLESNMHKRRPPLWSVLGCRFVNQRSRSTRSFSNIIDFSHAKWCGQPSIFQTCDKLTQHILILLNPMARSNSSNKGHITSKFINKVPKL